MPAGVLGANLQAAITACQLVSPEHNRENKMKRMPIPILLGAGACFAMLTPAAQATSFKPEQLVKMVAAGKPPAEAAPTQTNTKSMTYDVCKQVVQRLSDAASGDGKYPRTMSESQRNFVVKFWTNDGAVLITRSRAQSITLRGKTVAHAATLHGVSELTTREWLGRYLAGGEAALCDESSRPNKFPNAINPSKAMAIVELRRQARMARPNDSSSPRCVSGRTVIPTAIRVIAHALWTVGTINTTGTGPITGSASSRRCHVFRQVTTS